MPCFQLVAGLDNGLRIVYYSYMENKTTIDASIIESIAANAGASLANVTIMIDEAMKQRGEALYTSKGRCIIKLRQDWLLDTLAHELKHVEQYQSGLVDFIIAEQELEPYATQWHEIEAREFAKRYK